MDSDGQVLESLRSRDNQKDLLCSPCTLGCAPHLAETTPARAAHKSLAQRADIGVCTGRLKKSLHVNVLPTLHKHIGGGKGGHTLLSLWS